MSTADAVKFIMAAYPEYKGMLLFPLTDLAKVYYRGNTGLMSEFLIRHDIPYYLGGRNNRRYNIYEVQEAVEATRWASKPDRRRKDG